MMDGQGSWFQNEDSLDVNSYKDLRNSPESSWAPAEDILNINGTTVGCLSISKSGLLHTKFDSDCETSLKPACEYKTCMTTKGKRCLFPFVYNNDTHPSLTYKICSGLDVYRPWCPTKLDDSLNVLEWGDCLDDCPSEPINSACLTDPTFPSIADGSDDATNYTTNYTTGISVVTDELDYVVFTCPDGYVYEGTNNKSHYAICMHWEFIYLYDPEVLCVRKCGNLVAIFILLKLLVF